MGRKERREEWKGHTQAVVTVAWLAQEYSRKRPGCASPGSGRCPPLGFTHLQAGLCRHALPLRQNCLYTWCRPTRLWPQFFMWGEAEGQHLCSCRTTLSSAHRSWEKIPTQRRPGFSETFVTETLFVSLYLFINTCVYLCRTKSLLAKCSTAPSECSRQQRLGIST